MRDDSGIVTGIGGCLAILALAMTFMEAVSGGLNMSQRRMDAAFDLSDLAFDIATCEEVKQDAGGWIPSHYLFKKYGSSISVACAEIASETFELKLEQKIKEALKSKGVHVVTQEEGKEHTRFFRFGQKDGVIVVISDGRQGAVIPVDVREANAYEDIVDGRIEALNRAREHTAQQDEAYAKRKYEEDLRLYRKDHQNDWFVLNGPEKPEMVEPEYINEITISFEIKEAEFQSGDLKRYRMPITQGVSFHTPQFAVPYSDERTGIVLPAGLTCIFTPEAIDKIEIGDLSVKDRSNTRDDNFCVENPRHLPRYLRDEVERKMPRSGSLMGFSVTAKPPEQRFDLFR